MPILGTLASSVQKITGAFESIATVSPSGGTSSVNFTSIPSTYTSLQIRYIAKMTGTTGYISGIKFTANSTNSVYANHLITATGSEVSTDYNAPNYTFARLNTTNVPDSNSGYANMYGVGIIDVIDYASTTKNKTFRSFTGHEMNDSGNNRVNLTSNLFASTTAISSLQFSLLDVGSPMTFAAGTVFSLYGIKGA